MCWIDVQMYTCRLLTIGNVFLLFILKNTGINNNKHVYNNLQ